MSLDKGFGAPGILSVRPKKVSGSRGVREPQKVSGSCSGLGSGSSSSSVAGSETLAVMQYEKFPKKLHVNDEIIFHLRAKY